MEAFWTFMSSRSGRWLRLVVGGSLLSAGLAHRFRRGWMLTALGLAPIAAGALDVCLLAPLWGMPLQGPRLRTRLGRSARAPLFGGAEHGLDGGIGGAAGSLPPFSGPHRSL